MTSARASGRAMPGPRFVAASPGRSMRRTTAARPSSGGSTSGFDRTTRPPARCASGPSYGAHRSWGCRDGAGCGSSRPTRRRGPRSTRGGFTRRTASSRSRARGRSAFSSAGSPGASKRVMMAHPDVLRDEPSARGVRPRYRVSACPPARAQGHLRRRGARLALAGSRSQAVSARGDGGHRGPAARGPRDTTAIRN